MTAEIIKVDFAKRQVIRDTPNPVTASTAVTIDQALNKRLINDFTQVMLDSIDSLDLSRAVLLVPDESRQDVYLKLAGDLSQADLAGMRRMISKLSNCDART